MTDAVERTMIAAFEKTYFTYFSHFKKKHHHILRFVKWYIKKSLAKV